ncbi:hypothetical protein PB01_02950 [Psychrobacillus glaciei]|uniref:Uncharacterized protein n=1 Tax=Psychrobacillus glaciei TaxID=2283160 RepID=A0A5J6SK83_9BACI|nr:hypothetical protein [Psychrobacillus glaciei]QFF97853.1 hypothetical protein PB01_02950 [Psychrobacillus glaciei]
MKIILQAIIGSLLIHLIYIVYTFLGGYLKTKYYTPDITSTWDNVYVLQNEVAFGMVSSPFFYVFSFLKVAIICAILIFTYEKWFKNKVRCFKTGQINKKRNK